MALFVASKSVTEQEFIVEFTQQLVSQAKHKATLYDGTDNAVGGRNATPDFFLRFATEELGEVASAITRERWQLAYDECIDVAHAAMLIALVIKNKKLDRQTP